jgi:hypothetical protein
MIHVPTNPPAHYAFDVLVWVGDERQLNVAGGPDIRPHPFRRRFGIAYGGWAMIRHARIERENSESEISEIFE